jgi:hypothetical protein
MRSLSRGFAADSFRDCMFESHRWHGYLSLVSVVCCQVEVSALGRSLVLRSPTECGCGCLQSRNFDSKEFWDHKGFRAMETEKMRKICFIFRFLNLSLSSLRNN